MHILYLSHFLSLSLTLLLFFDLLLSNYVLRTGHRAKREVCLKPMRMFGQVFVVPEL